MNLSGSWVCRDKPLKGKTLSPLADVWYRWTQRSSSLAQLLRYFQPNFITYFILHLSSAFELLFVLYCSLLSLIPGYDFFFVTSHCPLFLLVYNFLTHNIHVAYSASCLRACVTRFWFSRVVLEMYGDVPANSGTYISAKGHTYASWPSSRAFLAILRPWLTRVVATENVWCSGLFWEQDSISLDSIISWIKKENV